MPPSIRLRNVTKSYDELAVNDLSLDIEEGEFLTLLGPSGCGKTTTLRLISGFERLDRGSIYIGETLVNHIPPFRRNVNTVFQNYALFPHMSVFDNIAYSLTLKRMNRREIAQKVHQMLDRVGLPAKVRNMPHELSGGERQRVALARALINEPAVLLLDEPLGALDAKLRRAMQIELKHVQRSLGITFIFVTHDQEEALIMSDRIAVMQKGRILQVGAPSDVFERPNCRFVAAFTGIDNQLHGTVMQISESGISIALTGGLHWTAAGRPADEIRVGGPVTAVVRPQKIGIHLSPRCPAPPGHNVAPAVLKEVIYAGTIVRFIVQLDNGAELLVENVPENLSFDYHTVYPGRPMSLHVPEAALLLYPG